MKTAKISRLKSIDRESSGMRKNLDKTLFSHRITYEFECDFKAYYQGFLKGE